MASSTSHSTNLPAAAVADALDMPDSSAADMGTGDMVVAVGSEEAAVGQHNKADWTVTSDDLSERLTWTSTAEANAEYLQARGKELALDRLRWDLRLEHG